MPVIRSVTLSGEPAGKSVAATRIGAEPIPVAVLDNDPFAAQALAAVLSHDPRRFMVLWQCTAAPEAVQRCLHAKVRPRVLVCDIALSGLTGMDACRMLGAADASIGVVLVTAYDPDEYTSAAADAGARAVVGKSEAVGGLMQAVWDAAHDREPSASPDVRESPGNAVDVSAARAGTTVGVRLSDRERTVMRLFAQGSSLDDVAARLNVTRNTVMTYTHRVLRKLGAGTRREALDICDRYDLLM